MNLLPLFIGLRYTKSKPRLRFVSFLSVASMLGIALGVIALITVLSVMNGFERELRERILGMTAHALLTASDSNPLPDWRIPAALLGGADSLVAVAPYLEEQGLLISNYSVTGITLRGILPNRESSVSILADKMLVGALTELQPGKFNLAIGIDLARTLGVLPGDKLILAIPQTTATPLGALPRFRRFTVTGLFQIGMYEYDSALAVINLQDADRLFQLESEAATGLQLKFSSLDEAPKATQNLAERLPATYTVKDWSATHAALFRAVHTEQIVMFTILALTILVSAFNIIATLMVVVTDKGPDVAILRTLGMTPGQIGKIFMTQGTIIGVTGTLLGLLGGVELALSIPTLVPALEKLFGFQLFSAQVYYVTELPSELHWSEVIATGFLALGLTLLATIYPSWKASRVQPAAVLRCE